jgi:hypothetical protein
MFRGNPEVKGLDFFFSRQPFEIVLKPSRFCGIFAEYCPDQFKWPPGPHIFAALSLLMLLQSLREIIGNAGIERTVPAMQHIDAPFFTACCI